MVTTTPMEILLIEDNEWDIKITLRTFNNARMKNNVSVLRDGQEALDYFKGQEQKGPGSPMPDIVILDINLPKVDGFDVLKYIKCNERLKHIPVVVLTCSHDNRDILKSYRLGANSYIAKPVDQTDFENFIDVFNSYWRTVNILPSIN